MISLGEYHGISNIQIIKCISNIVQFYDEKMWIKYVISLKDTAGFNRIYINFALHSSFVCVCSRLWILTIL